MKLEQLVEFAQMYHDMGIDFQVQLEHLISGEEHTFNYDTLSTIKEWLTITAVEINNTQLTKDIATVIERINTHF
jgi:hypothetical protein